jgi:hypothetical protein
MVIVLFMVSVHKTAPAGCGPWTFCINSLHNKPIYRIFIGPQQKPL